MVNHGNMYGPSFTFLGIAQCDLDDPASFAGADVVIVGAPIDSGTSHRSGAKFGPQAIRGGDYLPHDASRPHLASTYRWLERSQGCRCWRFDDAWGRSRRIPCSFA